MKFLFIFKQMLYLQSQDSKWNIMQQVTNTRTSSWWLTINKCLHVKRQKYHFHIEWYQKETTFFLEMYLQYHKLQPFIEHNCKGCVNIQVVCSGKKLRLICLLKSSFHFQSKNQNSKWKSCQKIIVEIEEASVKIMWVFPDTFDARSSLRVQKYVGNVDREISCKFCQTKSPLWFLKKDNSW